MEFLIENWYIILAAMALGALAVVAVVRFFRLPRAICLSPRKPWQNRSTESVLCCRAARRAATIVFFKETCFFKSAASSLSSSSISCPTIIWQNILANP